MLKSEFNPEPEKQPELESESLRFRLLGKARDRVGNTFSGQATGQK